MIESYLQINMLTFLVSWVMAENTRNLSRDKGGLLLTETAVAKECEFSSDGSLSSNFIE